MSSGTPAPMYKFIHNTPTETQSLIEIQANSSQGARKPNRFYTQYKVTPSTRHSHGPAARMQGGQPTLSSHLAHDHNQRGSPISTRSETRTALFPRSQTDGQFRHPRHRTATGARIWMQIPLARGPLAPFITTILDHVFDKTRRRGTCRRLHNHTRSRV